MASAALFDPTLHAAYYQHRWASQKENGVLVCVRDVLRFKRAFPALFEAGAVRLYRHAQWPCVYATVVATVVALSAAMALAACTPALSSSPSLTPSPVPLLSPAPSSARTGATAPRPGRSRYGCRARRPDPRSGQIS